MTRSFKVPQKLLAAAPVSLKLKEPRVMVRAGLGVLVLANIIAALLAFKPWGGSAEDLARQRQDLRQQLATMQARLAKTKALVTKAQRARQEGDHFLAEYTTDRRTTFSTILSELDRVAREAGVQTRPLSTELQPVEGSESLFQLSINAAYEGNYASFAKFVNLLDRSPKFLIIESMQAQPQQTNAGDLLNVTIKLDTFVREQPGSVS